MMMMIVARNLDRNVELLTAGYLVVEEVLMFLHDVHRRRMFVEDRKN